MSLYTNSDAVEGFGEGESSNHFGNHSSRPVHTLRTSNNYPPALASSSAASPSPLNLYSANSLERSTSASSSSPSTSAVSSPLNSSLSGQTYPNLEPRQMHMPHPYTHQFQLPIHHNINPSTPTPTPTPPTGESLPSNYSSSATPSEQDALSPKIAKNGVNADTGGATRSMYLGESGSALSSAPASSGALTYSEPPSALSQIPCLLDIDTSQPEIFSSVTLSGFAEYVSQCSQTLDGGFDQFDIEMEVLTQLSSTAEYNAKIYRCPKENLKKNRYINVLPNAKFRVRLGTLSGDPFSDYINASYVTAPLPGCLCKYVAAQAPIPVTFIDWWRMIWEQNSPVIMMLTREREKDKNDYPVIKAHRYWPDEPGKSLAFGPFIVTLQEKREEGYPIAASQQSQAESLTDTVLRIFTVSNSATKEKRTVTHIQFVGWPDHSVPDEYQGFTHFFSVYRKIRDQSLSQAAQEKREMGPILTHCSAGIGRTGTFCTIDLVLDYLASNLTAAAAQTTIPNSTNGLSASSSSSSSSSPAAVGVGGVTASGDPPINIFNVVRALRESRPGMVQSKAQYQFCFYFIRHCVTNRLFF